MRWATVFACAATLFFLYFFGLTRTGMLGPDEPRYAAIGRTMADTGDWVTPRLWERAWFEKPPLLYWMTAVGFKVGFDQDLAPRVPVALASVAFLIYFFVVLRREFGEQAAFYSTAILSTSAGWLAYSHVAVTDLPLTAALAVSMLTLLRGPLKTSESLLSGAMLGLAVLAKGLVPLALFPPAVWFLRKQLKGLLIIVATAAVVAAPWYAVVIARNGSSFLEEFFVRQHFGRLASAALGHQQPFWFYLPVLLAGLFPWTPFLMLLFQRHAYKDRRAVFLLAWAGWVVVFFSVFLNKLPGYLLPALPPFAALLGITIASAKERSIRLLWSMSLSAAMLCFLPSLEDLLPGALLHGLSRTAYQVPPFWIIPAFAAGLLCSALARVGRRKMAISLIALGICLAVIRLVWQVYPALDRMDSARDLWLSHSDTITCVPESDRARRYGLEYYANHPIPDCN